MRLIGLVDRVHPSVQGWVYDADRPEVPVRVTVLVDGQKVVRSRAGNVRPDVSEAGHGTSFCGFDELLPSRYDDGEPHLVRVLAGPEDEELEGSPRQIVVGDAIATPRSGSLATGGVMETYGDLSDVSRMASSSGRVALLATHRTGTGRSRHLEALIAGLHAIGAGVVCIDTTDELTSDPADGADLRLVRENTGWDFGSWLAGLDVVRPLLDSVDELILINDSTYGPLVGLDELFASSSIADADAWAVTDSWEIGYHLQSYFLVLRRPALRSAALWAFVERYPFPRSKADVVWLGEIGLTRALRDGGLRVAAAHPYEDVARQWLASLDRRLAELHALPEAAPGALQGLSMSPADWLLRVAAHVRARHPVDPSHVFWHTLLERAAPFLKRDLVLTNPRDLASLPSLRSELARFPCYDSSIVLDDARSVTGSLVPLL